MAAELNDVVKLLQQQNGILSLSIEGSATQQAKASEAAAERKQYDTEVLSTLKGIQTAIGGSFTAVQKDKKKGGLLAGILGAMGAGIGAIAKSVAKIGVGFAIGMTSLGAGIAGFMLAIGGIALVAQFAGVDGEALKVLIQNFFGAFDAKAAGMMGGIIALAILMEKLKISKVQMALGMAAVGAGIAGFFGAILIGDGIATIAGSAGLNGTALATLMTNFFGAFTPEAVALMGGMTALAVIAAKLNVDKLAIAKGMTAIGAGFAGFFVGILAADLAASVAGTVGIDGGSLKTLMSNFFGAFSGAGIEGTAVLFGILGAGAVIGLAGKGSAKKMALGMTAVGAGLAGFFVGILLADLAASLAGAVGIDGTSLKTLMANFFGAFSGAGIEGTAALFVILGAGALAGLAGKTKAKDIALGMTAVGAGLAGFFTGVLLADLVAKAGTAIGLDGSSLSTLINNFVLAFKGTDTAGLAAIGGLLAIGALVGIVKGEDGAKGIAKGMTAVGAGLAGFFTGVLLADLAAGIGSAIGLDGSSLSTLINNFMLAFSGASAEGLTALGLLLAVGAGIGLIAGKKGSVNVAIGMTAVGAGLAGFFGGLMLADKFAETLGTAIPGANLRTMMDNFFLSFANATTTGLAALGILLVAGAAFGIAGPAVALNVALGMTAMGAGLAGFFGGLMLADKFADTLGTKIPGANLSSMMTNLFSALSSATPASLKILGGLLVAGAAIGILLPGVGPAGVALGMTAVGAGIAGFFAGLLLADVAISKLGGEDAGAGIATLLTNLGRGLGGFVGGFGESMMKQLDTLNADKLSKLGGGIKDLGIGILAFAGGQGVGAVTGIMESIGSLFGSKSPLESIGQFAKSVKDEDAERLAKLGKGIDGLGTGLLNLSQVDAENIEKNLEKLKTLKNLSSVMPTGTTAQPFAAFPMKQFHEGGVVTETGPAILKAGEFVLDEHIGAMVMRAAEMLEGSREMERSSGGSPIVVNNNNVDNSQSNSSSQATTLRIPESVRSAEPTMSMALNSMSQ